MSFRSICWSCITSLILLGVAAFLSKEWFDQYRRSHELEQFSQKIEERLKPIMTLEEFKIDPDKIKRGGDLVVKYKLTREQLCMSVVQRYIINPVSGVVVWTSVSPSILTDVGANQSGESIVKVPDFIQPGNYVYRITVFNGECADGRTSAVPSPPVPFTIMP
jgi:hypothetical protein